MQDPLIEAAQRLGIATRTSAGPEPGSSSGQLWATWPRDRLEIAHEALARLLAYDRKVRVVPSGRYNVWRAYASDWCYEGDFVDAVATLALHVAPNQSEHERTDRATTVQ